ncbi:MAG: hypothetical protein LBE12_02680 [Planctomycetaceae bacterium]|jgi:hypothetical protein|nr:hypothetical protein [Planctomycetaceae bacterium]
MVKNFSGDFGILWAIVHVNYPEVGNISPKRYTIGICHCVVHRWFLISNHQTGASRRVRQRNGW